MTMTNYKNQKGFTLIELLVVMAIMGILMAMIVPKAGRLIDSAKEQKCRNNLKQLQVAVMSYMNDNGGNLPPASSYEWLDRETGYYRHFRGWVSWMTSSKSIRDLDELWDGDNKLVSQENKLFDDLGTGEAARFGVENGLLFQYMNNSFEHYVCPVMKAKKKDRDTDNPTTIYRTYAMNTFFRSAGNRSDQHIKATRIGTSETLTDFPDTRDEVHYKPESAKLLLFAEVVPSEVEDDAYKHQRFGDVPQNQGDGCINPLRDKDGVEYIAFDSSPTSQEAKYGIHNSPIAGVKASLAVFFDGHIEKVFSTTKPEDPANKNNTAWYLVRGLDPTL